MTSKSYRGFKRLSDLFFNAEDPPLQECATPILSAASTSNLTSSVQDADVEMPTEPEPTFDPESSRLSQTPDPPNFAKCSPVHRSPGIMTSITGSVRGMNRSVTKRFAKQAAKCRDHEELEQENKNMDNLCQSPIQHSSPIPIPKALPEDKLFISKYPTPALELDLPQTRLSSGSLAEFMSADRHDSVTDLSAPETVKVAIQENPNPKHILSFSMEEMFLDDEVKRNNTASTSTVVDTRLAPAESMPTMKIKRKGFQQGSLRPLTDFQLEQANHAPGVRSPNSPARHAIIPASIIDDLNSPATLATMATASIGEPIDNFMTGQSPAQANQDGILYISSSITTSVQKERLIRLINYLEHEAKHHPETSNENLGVHCYMALLPLFTARTHAYVADVRAVGYPNLNRWDVIRGIAETTGIGDTFAVLSAICIELVTHAKRVHEPIQCKDETENSRNIPLQTSQPYPADARWLLRYDDNAESEEYGPYSGKQIQEMFNHILTSNNTIPALYVKSVECEEFVLVTTLLGNLQHISNAFLRMGLEVGMMPKTKDNHIPHRTVDHAAVVADTSPPPDINNDSNATTRKEGSAAGSTPATKMGFKGNISGVKNQPTKPKTEDASDSNDSCPELVTIEEEPLWFRYPVVTSTAEDVNRYQSVMQSMIEEEKKQFREALKVANVEAVASAIASVTEMASGQTAPSSDNFHLFPAPPVTVGDFIPSSGTESNGIKFNHLPCSEADDASSPIDDGDITESRGDYVPRQDVDTKRVELNCESGPAPSKPIVDPESDRGSDSPELDEPAFSEGEAPLALRNFSARSSITPVSLIKEPVDEPSFSNDASLCSDCDSEPDLESAVDISKFDHNCPVRPYPAPVTEFRSSSCEQGVVERHVSQTPLAASSDEVAVDDEKDVLELQLARAGDLVGAPGPSNPSKANEEKEELEPLQGFGNAENRQNYHRRYRRKKNGAGGKARV